MIPAVRGPDPTGLEGGRGADPIPSRRLGFAVKIAGRPDLKDHDSRRWQNGPHLRVSLQYLNQIFAYLAEHGIRMYRISSDIAPFITHPDLPQFHHQIDECRDGLIALGERTRALDLRLSMHPAQYIMLNSPDGASRGSQHA